MKNILFIVIDSINNNQIFNKKDGYLKAPFLNELRKKTITGDNMFSQAPYTEAALNALLGSINTMDNNGYLERFKNKKSVLKILSSSGYKTYFQSFYPCIYPSYVDYGADTINYVEGFNFHQVWDYRLDYYSELFLDNKTTKEENQFLLDILEDNFNCWFKYLNLLKKKSNETKMLNECLLTHNEINKAIQMLKIEHNNFNKDKVKYLTDLFKIKKDHDIFKIPLISYQDKIKDDKFRDWFINKYYNTFKKIKRTQFQKNLKNAKFPFKKFCTNIKNKNIVKGLIAAYKNLLFDQDLLTRINYDFDFFKAARSFRTIAYDTMDLIKKSKDEKWMIYLHLDDPHYPESFFTYDTNDKKIIEKEFDGINNFIENLPPDYCGTIASDLSLLYCDSIMKEIYEFLEVNNLIHNTSIVITSDHGFSYYFNPIREKYVISSYKENYNVPFLIIDSDIKPRNINKFLSTKDIPATIVDLAGIKVPADFKGESLLSFEGRNHATIEYMGSGCPDIKRKPIILGVRTENYGVVMNVYLEKDFSESTIEEIYDLKHDELENHNLKNKKNITNLIANEIEIIKKRYVELRRNNGNEKN